MFCQYCGAMLNEDAAFCSKCGKQVSSEKFPTHKKTNPIAMQSSERKNLVRYLFYMRGLEITKQRLSDEYWNTKNKVDGFGTLNYTTTRNKVEENNLGTVNKYVRWDGESALAFGVSAGICLLIGLAAFGISKTDFLGSWLTFLPGVSIFFFVLAAITILLFIYVLFSEGRNERENLRKIRREENIKIEKHNSQVDSYNANIDRQRKEKEVLNRKLNELYKQWLDIDKETKLLYEKANVIPTQYRGLYEIYYLYEFMSSSHESLSQALLSCDLDAIKKQLSVVIQQNSMIIENQLKQIALQEIAIQTQDAAIASQEKNNKAQIDWLRQIKTGVDQSTEAARIAASNAEACAWIAAANYIK